MIKSRDVGSLVDDVFYLGKFKLWKKGLCEMEEWDLEIVRRIGEKLLGDIWW